MLFRAAQNSETAVWFQFAYLLEAYLLIPCFDEGVGAIVNFDFVASLSHYLDSLHMEISVGISSRIEKALFICFLMFCVVIKKPDTSPSLTFWRGL